MNDQIQELIQEAIDLCREKDEIDSSYEGFIEQELVRLVVQKCIDIVGDGGEFCSRPKLVEKLKEHFGVEE